METKTLEYVPANEIIPEKWQEWFWDIFSSDAPFSWGDNNVTLIKASRFADHFENRMDLIDDIETEELDQFVETVRSLGNTLIALEL